ncbi:MAG: flagellar biosynthesis protein FlgB [Acidobacteria bacterium]|nr:flagellar biosynthesis protein FlgB [Acidobacteriota bacterium]
MDLLSARQKLVASNIANIDTPGYKTRDVDFHLEFLNQLGNGPSQTKDTATVVEPDLPSRNDGNNVSLDRETRMVAENGLRFQMASLMARGQFKTLRTAIQEGKGG